MKVLLQRVTAASVKVDDQVVGRIGKGLVAFVGVTGDDSERDIQYLVDKVVNLRIFSDENDKFNISATEIGAEVLIISQFTLMADTRKGRRPSFIGAAAPEYAESLFNMFIDEILKTGITVAEGRFQQHMLVEIHNDGPVTIMLDSKDKFN